MLNFALSPPPRLTLKPLVWSTVKPPRLMLGGGSERGVGASGRAQTLHIGHKLPTRVKQTCPAS